MESIMCWVWLGLIVAFVILEAVTAELVSIWFVAGAVVAFVGSLFELKIWLQISLFVAVSLLVLIIVRPLLLKKTRTEMVPTNADMLIGKTGIVVNEINNDLGVGRIEVAGLGWAAVNASGNSIEKGRKVKIEKIEGVKLIVTPIEKEN